MDEVQSTPPVLALHEPPSAQKQNASGPNLGFAGPAAASADENVVTSRNSWLELAEKGWLGTNDHENLDQALGNWIKLDQ